jgi:protein transport protein SEC13
MRRFVRADLHNTQRCRRTRTGHLDARKTKIKMSAVDRGSFETSHSDAIHDCAYDYFGRRVATSSSDRTVRIFDVEASSGVDGFENGGSDVGADMDPHAGANGTSAGAVDGRHVATLTGHDGPVWCARWSHPKFGTLLATASFDHHVMIHKETEPNVFVCAYKTPVGTHDGSVNAVAWAPHEYGAQVACASSDGSISIISYDTASGQWRVQKIDNAHAVGCTGVSWAPAAMPGSLVSGGGANADARRLVTCGCDNLVKVWRFDESQNIWGCEATLSAHSDWVRDVAWSDNLGLPMNTIASCGQDGKVFIWTQSEPRGPWTFRALNDFGVPVWRVSWSTMGNILAVSDGNNTVTVWKESIDGAWNQLSTA